VRKRLLSDDDVEVLAVLVDDLSEALVCDDEAEEFMDEDELVLWFLLCPGRLVETAERKRSLNAMLCVDICSLLFLEVFRLWFLA
jgi:hypothetical protein